MKKKWNKRNKLLLIFGVASLGVGGITTTSVLLTREKPSVKDGNLGSGLGQGIKPVNFVDNRNDMLQGTLSKPESTLTRPNLWDNFDDNPHNPLYDSVYQEINLEYIESDAKLWLMSLVSQFSKLKINVSEINSIKNEETGEVKLTINFELYNDQQRPATISMYSLGSNQDGRYPFKGYEVLKNSISINGILKRKLSLLQDSAYVGYYFDRAIWNYGNKTLPIENFEFSNYSKSFNKKIVFSGAETKGRGYADIEQEANVELSKITGTEIANDIVNTNINLQNKIRDNLSPSQNILQNLARNLPLNEFLNQSAIHITSLIKSFSPGNNDTWIEMADLLEDLLLNKNIFNIFVENKNVMKKFLSGLNIGDNVGIVDSLFELSEEELKKFAQNLLANEQVENLIPESLKATITSFMTNGALETLINNASPIIDFISTFITNEQESKILNLLKSLFATENLVSYNKPILNLMIDISKVNSGEESFLKQMLKLTLPSQIYGQIGDLLNQVLVGNSNLTVDKLQKAISAVANPKTTKKGNVVIDMLEYWKNMKVTNVVTKAEFDQSTKIADLVVTSRYQFTSQMWIDIGAILDLLPPTVTFNGTNIPASSLIPRLSDWVSLNPNDYISSTTQIRGKIHYDVVKDGSGRDVLSWQANATETIDVYLPQSVRALWDDTGTGTGELIKKIGSDLLFKKYQNVKRYKPYSSPLNSNIVKNYNDKKITNKSIKEIITPEALALLKTEIEKTISTSNTGATYKWGGWWSSNTITQTQTLVTFDQSTLASSFLEQNGGNLEDFPIYTNLTTNRIVSASTIWIAGIIRVEIPNVTNSQISFWTTHQVRTSDSQMSDNWFYSW